MVEETPIVNEEVVEPIVEETPKAESINIEELLKEIKDSEVKRDEAVKQEAVSEANKGNQELIQAVTNKLTNNFNQLFDKQQKAYEDKINTINSQMEEVKGNITTQKGVPNMDNPNETKTQTVQEVWDSWSDQQRIDYAFENFQSRKHPMRYGASPYKGKGK